MGTYVIPFLSAFILSCIAGPILIPFLKRLKFGQTERDNGPSSHLKKKGTPTIGAWIFLIPLILITVGAYFIFGALGREYDAYKTNTITLLLVTLGFAVVGSYDDYLKVIKKHKDGLKAKQKMILLFIVSLIFSVYLYMQGDTYTIINLDFFGLHGSLDLGFWFIPLTVFILVSITNAVNLTDGVDGLCTGSIIIVLAFFVLISLTFSGNQGIRVFCITLIGGLCGFLIFNYHPAKIFMGDTGSLALGGAIGATAILLKMPFVLLLVGLLYVIEVMSDILQVAYFKKTHGKRLFKMAPIHHHFELLGWSELKVVYVFWTFTLLCCILAYFCITL